VGRATLLELRQDLISYKETFAALSRVGTATDMVQASALAPHLRDQGKDLVDLVHQFVATQRARILGIVVTLKHQLSLSIASFTGVAIFFPGWWAAGYSARCR